MFCRTISSAAVRMGLGALSRLDESVLVQCGIRGANLKAPRVGWNPDWAHLRIHNVSQRSV